MITNFKHCVGYRGGNVVERPEILAEEIKNDKIMSFEDFKTLFDMKEFDIESYLENAELAGRVDEISDIWYLWPGFSFFRYELLKNKRVNFRRHRKWYLFKVPRVDTGSANWYPLYSKYDKKKVKKVAFYGWNIVDNKPVKKEEIKGKFIQEKMVDYSSDKIWFHSTCGSEWRDVKGKNQIIYKILNSVLSDSITSLRLQL